MKTINLQNIIDSQELDTIEVAKQLFPNNKYPKLAINRILDGSAFLDSNQISKLSMLTGIPIELLYSDGKWSKAKATDGLLKFTADDYTAELNTKDWTTKLYHKDSLFHEDIIHDKSIPLSEYLSQLSNLIIKHSKP